MRFLAVALARLAVAATWTTLSPLPHGTLQEHITLPISSTQLVTLGGLVSNGSTTTLSLLYNIPTDKWTITTPSLASYRAKPPQRRCCIWKDIPPRRTNRRIIMACHGRFLRL